MSFDKEYGHLLSFLFLPAVLKNKSDLIFATSTPLTVCIPAIILKIFTEKDLFFEVRDLWPELPIAFGAIKSNINIFSKIIRKSCLLFCRCGNCLITRNERGYC